MYKNGKTDMFFVLSRRIAHKCEMPCTEAAIDPVVLVVSAKPENHLITPSQTNKSIKPTPDTSHFCFAVTYSPVIYIRGLEDTIEANETVCDSNHAQMRKIYIFGDFWVLLLFIKHWLLGTGSAAKMQYTQSIQVYHVHVRVCV